MVLDAQFSGDNFAVYLTPLTPEAHHWVQVHLIEPNDPADVTIVGDTVFIDHDYANDIYDGMIEDGLEVAGRSY